MTNAQTQMTNGSGSPPTVIPTSAARRDLGTGTHPTRDPLCRYRSPPDDDSRSSALVIGHSSLIGHWCLVIGHLLVLAAVFNCSTALAQDEPVPPHVEAAV